MANTYRPTRNIEASLVDFLSVNFSVDFSGVSVEKVFSRVYDTALPVVCVLINTTIHDKAEIGSDSTTRKVTAFLHLFCTSDGQREDFADYIVNKIKGGFIYYDYVINNGSIQSKTANGRIRVLSVETSKIDFDTNPSELDVYDRYRGLVELTLSLGRVES